MKMKKCPKCGFYTMKDNCPKCNAETKEAHYKYIKIKNAEKNTN